ncbi:hypothetical protein BT69DRAFT_1275964 [Atractiella rhizophila]|nr:hypothetical protein BT69DRAFT_1275964 [Atractiella rhizophila]
MVKIRDCTGAQPCFRHLGFEACEEVTNFGNYIGTSTFAPEYNAAYSYGQTAITISAPDDIDSGNWQPIEYHIPRHIGLR